MSQQLETVRKEYDDGYYQNKLDQGLEFQDVVTSALYQRGIVVVAYSSRRFQIEKGENLLGAEIKRDGKFRETGNLYIETAEKSHPDIPFFTDSGIHRKDNSWLYVIGDEKTIFIFSTKYLCMLERKKKPDKKDWYPRVTKITSLGFLLPLTDADKYCIRKIDL